MKTIYLITTLLIVCFQSTAQLTSDQKKLWKKEVKQMEETDQYYRQMMTKNPAMNNDSVWKLQSAADSINKAKFVELTKLYGYPSKKNIGYEASIAIILHFTNEQDFIALKELFKSELDKGNMLPEYYAWWYDRCLRNMKQPIYFGQYTNQKEFCGEEWRTFNAHRKEIGLEPLNGQENCN